MSDPEARYYGGRVEERSLVPLGEARLTTTRDVLTNSVDVAIRQMRGTAGLNLFDLKTPRASRRRSVLMLSGGRSCSSCFSTTPRREW